MRKSSRLPTRFPPGTKYVLESRGAMVQRYIELPDGRRLALSPRRAVTCCAAEVSLVPRLETTGLAPRRAKTARRRAKTLVPG